MSKRSRIRTYGQRAREVADNLGDDYKLTRDSEVAARRAAARAERNRQARTHKSGSFARCSIRGCAEKVWHPSGEKLPVCGEHAVDIWEMVERRDASPYLREFLSAEIEQRDRLRAEQREAEKTEARRQVNSLDAAGLIYFARVNELIKVGWSSDLYERMRSYGANAEVLAHYPGTRRDERDLHAQLTPARSKGREWYRDCDITQDFIRKAIEQHGAPVIKVDWRNHEADTPRPRRRSA